MRSPLRRRVSCVAPALAALVAGCAGAPARPAPDRAAAYATPVPDPACRVIVANALALNGLERVTVRAAVAGDRAVVDLLAPELTPAAAADVRRAFAECAWRPGANGAGEGEVEFTLR